MSRSRFSKGRFLTPSDISRRTRPELEALAVDAHARGDRPLMGLIRTELNRRGRLRSNPRAKKAAEPAKPQRKWYRFEIVKRATGLTADAPVPQGKYFSEAQAERAAEEFTKEQSPYWRETYQTRLISFTPMLDERLARVSKAATDVPEAQKQYAVFEKPSYGGVEFRGWYSTRKRAEMVASVARKGRSDVLIRTPQELKDAYHQEMESARARGLTPEEARKMRYGERELEMLKQAGLWEEGVKRNPSAKTPDQIKRNAKLRIERAYREHAEEMESFKLYAKNGWQKGPDQWRGYRALEVISLAEEELEKIGFRFYRDEDCNVVIVPKCPNKVLEERVRENRSLRRTARPPRAKRNSGTYGFE